MWLLRSMRKRSALDQVFARRIGKDANAQLRPLKIGQNGDRAASIGLDLTDDGMARGLLGMGAVAHVQAEHIGPCLKQRADHFIVAGGRAQSGHDLYVPKASHALFLFVAFNFSWWAARLMAQY